MSSAAEGVCSPTGRAPRKAPDLFNLSLQMETAPVLWKTCLAHLTRHEYAGISVFVAPETCDWTCSRSLQFGYQDGVGVDDAVLYFLHPADTHLEEPGGQVRIMFFDFEKVANMWVGPSSIAWISD